MNHILFALALTAGLALGPAGDGRAAEASPVMLTVFGAVGTPNRPPFDPFADAFLKGQDRTFAKARAFSRAALAALPQATVTARAQAWRRPVTATGPRLKDVLAAAGVAPDAPITVIALDGYGAEFDGNDRRARDWILAITVDGEPLSIGGRGPAWLLYGTGDAPADADAETQWVWSVYAIEAE